MITASFGTLWWPSLVSIGFYSIDLGLTIWGLLLWLEASDDETAGAMPAYRAWVVNEIPMYIEYFSVTWTFVTGLIVALFSILFASLGAILAMFGI